MRLSIAVSLIILTVMSFTGCACAHDMAHMDMNPVAPAMTAPAIGGAFHLVDQDGHAVTDRDYSRYYKLVYFGFTNCPDTCPVTLHALAAATQKLGPQAKDLRILFVTTDPARDTPAALKKYLTLFAPAPMTGLTGTPKQIASAEAAYKVYAQKRQDPALNGYTVDHSAVVYFMSPDNKPLDFFGADDNAATITVRLKSLIK